MSDDELKAKYAGLLDPNVFVVQKVESVNFMVDGLPGHPFTIGPEHVAYAADHCNGILGTEVMEKLPCACDLRHTNTPTGRGTNFWHGQVKCGRPFSAHTSEKALFLLLVRDLTNKEATDALLAVKAEAEKDNVAGFAFPNLGKPYKIAKPEGE